MAKPIFLVKIPAKFKEDLDTQQAESIQTMLDEKLFDYHALVYFETSNSTEISFTVLNAIDARDIDIESLRKELNELIKSNK